MNIQMIAISHCKKSQYYSKICLDAWNSFGYEVKWFEATTPNSLVKEFPDVYNGELKFAKTKRHNNNRFTPTEIAIWYSHYRLWQYTVTSGAPVHIIEHDTYPYKRLCDFEDSPISVFSMFPAYEGAWMGKDPHISPGSGYYIRPEVANAMIEHVRGIRINENVDGFILNALMRAWTMREYRHINEQMLNYCSCFQLYNEAIGTSASHNDEYK